MEKFTSLGVGLIGRTSLRRSWRRKNSRITCQNSITLPYKSILISPWAVICLWSILVVRETFPVVFLTLVTPTAEQSLLFLTEGTILVCIHSKTLFLGRSLLLTIVQWLSLTTSTKTQFVYVVWEDVEVIISSCLTQKCLVILWITKIVFSPVIRPSWRLVKI